MGVEILSVDDDLSGNRSREVYSVSLKHPRWGLAGPFGRAGRLISEHVSSRLRTHVSHRDRT
jgi:hypothetical protein